MGTWKPDDYRLHQPTMPDSMLAEKVFALVWRFDFAAPGFCVIETGPDVDSHKLRSWMVGLKERLSEVAVRRGCKPFLFRSMGRFDQQETTKFHLDGAPAESMLMLGYEPSQVQSRLFLGDYSRAAFDLGITPGTLLEEYNPMYVKGEELLSRYSTELPELANGTSRILLINNSSLSFTEARTHPLGVMHKAVIITPDEAKRRIVNSTMLVTEGQEIGVEMQNEFVATDKISKKVY